MTQQSNDIEDAMTTGNDLASSGQSTRIPRWIKIALALSLTVNLSVLALVAGVAASGMPGGRGLHMGGDVFGAYAQALEREDRRALFRAMREQTKAKGGKIGQARAERAANLAAVAESLRADPFRPADLKAALERQKASMQGQIDLAHQLLLDHLSSLGSAKRLAIADRLMRHMPPEPPAP